MNSAAPSVGPIRSLRLPVRTRELEQVFDETARPALAPRRLNASTAAKVLVAEDNRVNQAIAQRMLELLGASVVVVDNGREAVDRVSRERFDIVFMDCQMPSGRRADTCPSSRSPPR